MLVGVAVKVISIKELVEWDRVLGSGRVKQHFGRVYVGQGIGNMPVEDIRTSLESIPRRKLLSHCCHLARSCWSSPPTTAPEGW